MILSTTLPDGTVVPVEIRRRRQRRLILHAEPETMTFWMSAPRSVPVAELQRFLDRRIGWIVEMRSKLASYGVRGTIPCLGQEYPLEYTQGQVPSFTFEGGTFSAVAPTYDAAEALFWKWWYEHAASCYVDHTQKWILPLDLEFLPHLRIRPLKRSWGICYTRTCSISLAERLYALPEQLLDYVILHELAHVHEPNHGPGFRALMQGLMPDWDEKRAALEKYEPLTAVIWPRQQPAAKK